jgi:hypothetical protein
MANRTDVYDFEVSSTGGGKPTLKFLKPGLTRDSLIEHGMDSDEYEVIEYSPPKDHRRDFGGEPKVGLDEYHPGDDFQTPPYAVEALAPFFPHNFSTVWEPAAGDGLLAKAIRERLFITVYETGIEDDFFDHDPCKLPGAYDAQVTNPPWSKKYEWLERSLEQRRPFALLLPSKIIFAARAIRLIENYDLEIIQVYPRIGYKSVNMTSFLESQPQLDSCWLTWGFRIGRRMTYAYIGDAKKRFLGDLRAEQIGQPRLF